MRTSLRLGLLLSVMAYGACFMSAGWGVAQENATARELEKTAAKGEPTAMYDLGVLYQYGWGVAQDYAKAREWYEKAAAKDNAEAKVRLEKLGTR